MLCRPWSHGVASFAPFETAGKHGASICQLYILALLKSGDKQTTAMSKSATLPKSANAQPTVMSLVRRRLPKPGAKWILKCLRGAENHQGFTLHPAAKAGRGSKSSLSAFMVVGKRVVTVSQSRCLHKQTPHRDFGQRKIEAG